MVCRSSRVQQYEILVKPLSTLKNHCEIKTCLADKPDTVLKSPDNSEQNKWGWFFDSFDFFRFFRFFFENFFASLMHFPYIKYKIKVE